MMLMSQKTIFRWSTWWSVIESRQQVMYYYTFGEEVYLKGVDREVPVVI